jgi:hypothetical protein
MNYTNTMSLDTMFSHIHLPPFLETYLHKIYFNDSLLPSLAFHVDAFQVKNFSQ